MTRYKDFEISVGDDPEHEDLTAEINYKQMLFAEISQEEGYNKLQIEIYKKPNGAIWSFLLADLVKVIEIAKQRLWELRKTE